MDIDGGLPYEADDSGPTAPPPAIAPEAETQENDVDMLLDKPLDDLIPDQRRGSGDRRPREPIPEHVQSLMGRMGKGKVYLADESPGIIHHDAERRIARDPRLTRLALELDKQDPASWLDAISEEAPSPIRKNALFVSSELIKHLSTSKVFTWASEFGVGVMGIEWLNDSTLILLFPTPAAALLSLSMLAKAGFDPTEGDDPLLERAAHGFPPSLLPLREPTPEPVPDPAAELDAELEMVAAKRNEGRSENEGTELLGDSAEPSENGVQRKGRGAFRADRKPKTSANGAFDLPPLASDKAEVRFAEGVDPHARVTVRYAMEDDNTKFKRGAGESSWYARHGRSAGKETAARRQRGGRFEEPLDLKDRVGTSGEGREFARRIGQERYEEREGRRGPRRPRVEDLDADLDRMRRGEDDGRDYGGRYSRERSDGGRYERRGRREGGGGGRAPRRPRANQDDLDRELDEMFASRGE